MKELKEKMNQVSEMSVVGKLFEKILKERMNLRSERRGLIRDRQHGFLGGRSRLTNLIECSDTVTRCVDEGSAS